MGKVFLSFQIILDVMSNDRRYITAYYTRNITGRENMSNLELREKAM